MNTLSTATVLGLISSLLLPLPGFGATVLEEIRRTGVLKVGIRQDAAPFGYVDEQGDWQGYCFDLANALQASLEEQMPGKEIQLEVVQSTLENRFEIVPDGTVHLECGPNTIRNDVPGVTFSTAFFITGTHFLIKAENTEQFAFGSNLAGLRMGALTGTITENFISEKYPQAELVRFTGVTGRADGVGAVASNEIDGFFSDGILLIGEVVRQDLSSDSYTLVPERPLTCDFYGLVLPAGDNQWRNTVNSFIDNQQAKEVWGNWFTALFPYVLLNLEHCDGKASIPAN